MLTPDLAELCLAAQRDAALERAHARERAGRAWVTDLERKNIPSTKSAHPTISGGPLALRALQHFGADE